MKKATLIFTLCLACMGIGSLNAEGVDIPLTDLYSVMPMDDKESNVVCPTVAATALLSASTATRSP